MKQRELARVEEHKIIKDTESSVTNYDRVIYRVFVGRELMQHYHNRLLAQDYANRLNREVSAHVAAMLKHELNKERKSGHVKGGGKQVKR